MVQICLPGCINLRLHVGMGHQAANNFDMELLPITLVFGMAGLGEDHGTRIKKEDNFIVVGSFPRLTQPQWLPLHHS